MDPIAITSTVIKLGETVAKLKNWIQSWLGGSIEITDPSSSDILTSQSRFKIKGKHTNPKGGKFWLLTRHGDKYWPQCRLDLQSDGRWNGDIKIEEEEDTKLHTVVLAQVFDFGDSLFKDYQKRGERTNWEPIEIKGPGKEFKNIQEIVITVRGSNPGGQPN